MCLYVEADTKTLKFCCGKAQVPKSWDFCCSPPPHRSGKPPPNGGTFLMRGLWRHFWRLCVSCTPLDVSQEVPPPPLSSRQGQAYRPSFPGALERSQSISGLNFLCHPVLGVTIKDICPFDPGLPMLSLWPAPLSCSSHICPGGCSWLLLQWTKAEERSSQRESSQRLC